MKYNIILPYFKPIILSNGLYFTCAIQMEDTLWSSLTDAHCKLPMSLTAEKLADQYGVTREDCDRFALASQQRWANGSYI